MCCLKLLNSLSAMKYFCFENAVHFGLDGEEKRRKKRLIHEYQTKLQQKAEIRRIFFLHESHRTQEDNNIQEKKKLKCLLRQHHWIFFSSFGQAIVQES